jgi:acyl carrier protein
VTTTTDAAVLTDVRAFLLREFLYMRPDFVLGDDDSLLKSGVVDSMGVLEVLEHLQERFGVRAGDDEITEANLGSLRAIARFVVAKQA